MVAIRIRRLLTRAGVCRPAGGLRPRRYLRRIRLAMAFARSYTMQASKLATIPCKSPRAMSMCSPLSVGGLVDPSPRKRAYRVLAGACSFPSNASVSPGHRVAIQLSRFRASALAGESPVNRSRNAERPPRPKRGGLSAVGAPSRRPNRNQSNRRGHPPGAHAGTNPSAGRRRFERKLNHPGEAGQPDPEQLSGSPDPATPPGDESLGPHIPKPRPKRKPRPACCPAAPRSRTCGTCACTSPGSPARPG